MRHIHSLVEANLTRPSVVTIGVFDGVHRGHQRVISNLLEAARSAEAASVVLTFFPYPETVLVGPQDRYVLTRPDEKAALLHELGVELVVTHPFNDEVRHLRAATFVDQLLDHLRMKELWVGADFAMGFQREGNIAFLQQQAVEKGFALRVVDLMDGGGEKVSSSRIRRALAAGEVAQAAKFLGRPFRLQDVVVVSDKRGQTIGFPTANLDIPVERAIPAHGVYAAWAWVADLSRRVPAVVNIGVRPTFDGSGRTVVEAHLLDFEGDLYGQELALDFLSRLRGEQRFDGVEALVAQINRDIEQVRVFFSAVERESA